jgi:hypothetical protein
MNIFTIESPKLQYKSRIKIILKPTIKVIIELNEHFSKLSVKNKKIDSSLIFYS